MKRRFRLLKGKHYERRGDTSNKGKKERIGVKFEAGVRGMDIVETDGKDLCADFPNKFVEVTGRPDDDEHGARGMATKKELGMGAKRRGELPEDADTDTEDEDVDASEEDVTPEPEQDEDEDEEDEDSGLTMKHKGGGKWDVFDGNGDQINDELLSKDEAEAMIQAQS